MQVLWISDAGLLAAADFLLRSPIRCSLFVAYSNHILTIAFRWDERLHLFEGHLPWLIGIYRQGIVGYDQMGAASGKPDDRDNRKDAEHPNHDYRTGLVTIFFVHQHIDSPNDEREHQCHTEVELPKRFVYFDFFNGLLFFYLFYIVTGIA
jgi:hypothetical protein